MPSFNAFRQLWPSNHLPVVGMLHLPPLPGSPRCHQTLSEIILRTLQDAETLTDAGFSGLMLENFGDTPFYAGSVPPITVAAMTAIAAAVRRKWEQPLGINVLRNDGRSALAIATAVDAAFIRVNILTGAMVTDQGIIAGQAHDLLRDRTALGATAIQIWGDVQVKHAAPLALRPLEDDVRDLIDRGHADAILVTGTATGKAPDASHLAQVASAAKGHPVLIASGVSPRNVEHWLDLADGLIVGASLKVGHDPHQPVSPDHARELMQAVRGWTPTPTEEPPAPAA